MKSESLAPKFNGNQKLIFEFFLSFIIWQI